jgi:hypothetical protein
VPHRRSLAVILYLRKRIHQNLRRSRFFGQSDTVPNKTLAPKVAAIPQPDGGILSMPLLDASTRTRKVGAGGTAD